MGLREVHLLMQKGEYKQALNILDSVTFEDQLDGKILKTELLIENGDLKKAASLAEETLKASRSTGKAVQKLKALINKGRLHSIFFLPSYRFLTSRIVSCCLVKKTWDEPNLI